MKTLLCSVALFLGLAISASLHAQTDAPASLPKELTLTRQATVVIHNAEGKKTGEAVLPKGAKVRPQGISGDKLTAVMENGDIAELDISATDYAEKAAQLSAKAAGDEAAIPVGESVDLNVEVTKLTPGGFLSSKRKVDGGTVEENIAVVGLHGIQPKEGTWWNGPAKKLGKFSPDEGKTIYFQYQATPRFGVKIDPPPGDKAGLPEVTYDEMKQLVDGLKLQEWLTTTARVTNNINSQGTYVFNARDYIETGIKENQIDYIRQSIPTWNKAAETADQWINNRPMGESYKTLCNLIIKANNQLGPNSIASMRNTIKQIQKQWQVIETIDGKSPVPEPNM